MEYGKAIRSNWLFEDNTIFLNNGSFGATPKQVLQAAQSITEQLEMQPIRFFMEEYPVLVRQAADKLAAFAGGTGDNLVFIDNATTGVNTVLKSLLPDLSKDDEIITTSHVYPAVRNALAQISRISGAKITEIEIPYPIDDKQIVIDRFSAALKPGISLAVIDHVTSPTGLVFPIEEIIRLCHANGTKVIIDGAHGPGMLPLNLDQLGADWYTGNCHKWLYSPKGAAFLYCKPENQENIQPLTTSNLFGEGFTQRFDWVGTRNPSSWLAVPAAIDFYHDHGGNEIMKHNHDLAIEAANLITGRLGVTLPEPYDMIGSMAAIILPERFHKPDFNWMQFRSELFNRFGVEVQVVVFNNLPMIRISAQIFNYLEEYGKLCDALEII
jgi:isopenicillin-N epimerase